MLSFIESTNTFRVVARTGSKLPVHCTVQGKIMLAHMTRAEVKRILREHGMQAYTANTKRSFEELEPELQRIREQGYAVDNSEFHAGLCSVAAPIYDENGNVCYAFSIVSMFHQLNTPEFRHVRNLALVAARDISFALGYRGDAFADIVESAETSGLLVQSVSPGSRRS